MYCPNCGNKTSAAQKFCRSCGLGLEKIAQSVVEQLPTTLDENLQDQKNKIERMGVAALSVFGVGILGLVLYGIVYKVILVQGRLMEGVGLLAFLAVVACGLLSVYLFAKADEVKTTRRLEQPEDLQTNQLRVKNTTAKLLPERLPDAIPSITERTTELLLDEKKRSP